MSVFDPLNPIFHEDDDLATDVAPISDLDDGGLSCPVDPPVSYMDLPTKSGVSGLATPPIAILSGQRTPRSQASKTQVSDSEEKAHASAVIERLSATSGRKKKKAGKRAPLLARKTTLGFTPATSGDEESEHSPGLPRGRRTSHTSRSSSLLRKDLHLGNLSGTGVMSNGRSSSPAPGASVLSQQIESICSRSSSARPALLRNHSILASDLSTASMTSGRTSEEESELWEETRTTSYEIPLENDFISPEISLEEKNAIREQALFCDGKVRKMHATDFEPLRCLGKGTFGTVILVKQKGTGRLFAQKQFRKASLIVRKKLVEQTRTERVILESVNRHPFVVKLYYAFQDHEKLYLILEYAQGGELFERMRNEHMFPEETAAFYMAEMVLALSHLHQTVGVVYRDLKPENCLLDAEGHLLLTDFGLSKVAADGEQCRSMTGTMEYMAPEVLLEQEYGAAVDWWSLGILGFDLLTGASPFQANNDAKIRERILKAKLVLPYFLSADSKDLLTRLLRRDVKKRLGANMPKDLQTIQQHRFFRKINWKLLAQRQVTPPIQPIITNPELAENFSEEFTSLVVSLPQQSNLLQTAASSLNPLSPHIAGSLSSTPTTSIPQPVNRQAGQVDDRTKESAHHASADPNASLAGLNGPPDTTHHQDPFGGFSFVGSRSLLEDAWL